MSVDAADPATDDFVGNPKLLGLLRQTQDIVETARKRVPNYDEIVARAEIDHALETWLGDELRVLRFKGRPLWNGSRDALFVREARISEAQRWFSSRQRAVDADKLDPDDESWAAYLISVTEP